MTIRNNAILVPVELTGSRGRTNLNLILDTGAQRTFIWRSAVPDIGLQKVTRWRASGIAGSKYATYVRARELRVGPIRMKKPVVALMNPGRYAEGFDGLLGMDFLIQVKYEVDYKREVIIWRGPQ